MGSPLSRIPSEVLAVEASTCMLNRVSTSQAIRPRTILAMSHAITTAAQGVPSRLGIALNGPEIARLYPAARSFTVAFAGPGTAYRFLSQLHSRAPRMFHPCMPAGTGPAKPSEPNDTHTGPAASLRQDRHLKLRWASPIRVHGGPF